MIQIILSILLVFTLLFLLFHYMFLNGRWPRKSRFHIDWNTVRDMAKDSISELPISIGILTIATGELPAFAVVAGDFTGEAAKIAFPSFQLVYSDKTAIIEAPFSKYLFGKFPYGKTYSEENYMTLQKAMLNADFIISTHEHWDHVGGISQSANLDILLPKTIMTVEQLDGPTIIDAEFPEHCFDHYTALQYDAYHRVGPGVVLIKAPGHSLGHQFVFIRLQNNKEFLFTGDVVWVNRNYEKRKNRPWIASKKRMENRRQIAHQMRYLYDTIYANVQSRTIMIATHDPEQHTEYIRKGIIGDGFIRK